MENTPTNDYIEQLKSDPIVQQWLSQFKYGNKDKFIEEYVELKYKLTRKPIKQNVNDSYRTKYVEIAEEALEAILAKKLFDLELRWRAKEITIEGVDISYDIGCWMSEPINCPFAPEITGEDIEIMRAFLLLPDFDSIYFDDHRSYWHNEIKKEIKEPGDELYWFKFHHKHVSNPTPLDLPDLKGDKEDYYEEMNKKLSIPKEEKKPLTKSTYKYIERNEREKLIVKLAEDLGLKDFVNFINDKNYYEHGQHPYESDYAWFYLNIHHDETIPLRANKNWAKGLYLAYQQHAAREAEKHLQAVVDAYKIKKENKITNQDRNRSFERLLEVMRNNILDGREKLGEPRNFDY